MAQRTQQVYAQNSFQSPQQQQMISPQRFGNYPQGNQGNMNNISQGNINTTQVSNPQYNQQYGYNQQQNNAINIQNQQNILGTNQVIQGMLSPQQTKRTITPALQQQLQQSYVPQVQPYAVSQPVDIIRPLKVESIQTVHEVHHNERPLQVVTFDDLESKWKSKCCISVLIIVHLEYLVYELQVEIQKLKANQGGGEVIVRTDDSRLQELMQQNKLMSTQITTITKEKTSVTEDLENWKNRYKDLENLYSKGAQNDEEIRALKRKIAALEGDLEEAADRQQNADEEIQRMNGLINERNAELQNLNNQLQDAYDQIQELEIITNTTTLIQGEVETWKKNFQRKNEEFTLLNEKYTMVQAELDALRNKKITENVSRTVTNNTSTLRSSQVGGGGGNAQGSQVITRSTAQKSSAVRGQL